MIENCIYLRETDVVNDIYEDFKREIFHSKVSKTEKYRRNVLNTRIKESFDAIERISLLKTCTGSGKTWATANWCSMYTKYFNFCDGFVFLSSEYQNGVDEIERLLEKQDNNIPYVRFEGKSRLCTQREETLEGTTVKVGELLKCGISIQNYCDNECEERGTCEYYANCNALREAPSGERNFVGVSHQLLNYLPIFLTHSGNITLMIDEDFTNAIKKHMLITNPVIRRNIKFLKKLLNELESFEKMKDDVEILAIRSLHEIFTHFFEKTQKVQKPEFDYIYKRFLKLGQLFDEDNFGFFELLENYAYQFVKEKRIKPFQFIFNFIGNFITNLSFVILKNKENEERVREWVKGVLSLQGTQFRMSFLFFDIVNFRKLMEKENILKVLINDATADKRIIEYLLGNNEEVLEINEDWMYDNCEIYQLKKDVEGLKKKFGNMNEGDSPYAQYVKSSFLEKGTFIHLIKDLQAISERHKNEEILVVARNIDGDLLRNITGGARFDDYIHSQVNNVIFEDYPLSGTNEYQHINVVVILGRPELSAYVIKRESMLFGFEPEEYRRYYSLSNIKQAMGRIFRGSEQKYVYLLTGFDVGLNREIKTFKGHKELRDYLDNIARINQVMKVINGRRMKIFHFLHKNKHIDVSTCSDLLGLSITSTRDFLNMMVKDGSLIINKIKFTEGSGRRKNYYGLKK